MGSYRLLVTVGVGDDDETIILPLLSILRLLHPS